MLTTHKRPTNMAQAFINASAKEIATKKVDHQLATVAPELSWVTRRVVLTEGNKGLVTEVSGAWRVQS